MISGHQFTFECHCFGARPTPNVSWWIDNVKLKPVSEKILNDNNITISQVVIMVKEDDDDKYLYCKVQSNSFSQVFESKKLLNIKCKDYAQQSIMSCTCTCKCMSF